MVENLIIQFTAAVCSSFPSFFAISGYLWNYPFYVSCTSTPLTWHSADEHNVWGECEAVSQPPVWKLEFRITDYYSITLWNYYGILYHRLLWKYDQH